MRYNLILLIAMLVFTAVPGAALNCQDCHSDRVSSVSANETIAITQATCFKCHRSEYAPEYEAMKGTIHSIHTGGMRGTNLDYLARHPKSSADCGTCHTYEITCESCHAVNIPHVANGGSCTSCHGNMDNVFRHTKFKLRVHDLFGSASCLACHDQNRKNLKLANGDAVNYEESFALCNQCHSNIYKAWTLGTHWVNATNVSENPKGNRCTTCHNAHDPTKLFWVPGKSDGDGFDYTYFALGLIPGITAFIASIYYYKKNKKRRIK